MWTGRLRSVYSNPVLVRHPVQQGVRQAGERHNVALTSSGPGEPSTVGRPGRRPSSELWPGDGIESIGSMEPDMSMVESEGEERPWNDIRGSRVGVSRGSEPRLIGEGGGRERASCEDSEPALLADLDLEVLVPD